MPRKAKPHKTFHISVPDEDTEILEWLSKQYNQSSSVRQLIREAARDVGMVDLFIGTPAARIPGVRGAAKQPARGEAERAQAQVVQSQTVTAQPQEAITQPMLPQTIAQPSQQLQPAVQSSQQQQPSQSVQVEPSATTPATTNSTPKKKTIASSPARKPKKKTSAGIQMDVSILDDALGSTSSAKHGSSLDKTMEEVDNMDKDAVDILKDLMDL